MTVSSSPTSYRALCAGLLLSLACALGSMTCAFGSRASAQSAPAPDQAQPQPTVDPNAPQVAPAPAAYPPAAYAQPAPGTAYAPPPGAPYAQPGTPYAQQPGAPYYASPESYRPRPRISRGMLIGGAITLGASYLLSATVGLALMGEDRSECIDCADVGPWLVLPVIGPFIGAGQAAGGEVLISMLGVVQLVGTGLLVGGIIRFKKTKRQAQEQGLVFELRDNRSLALDVKSTARFSGPELSLRF